MCRTRGPLKQSLFSLSCAQFRCPVLNLVKELTQCFLFVFLSLVSLRSMFTLEISHNGALGLFFSCLHVFVVFFQTRSNNLEVLVTGFYVLHSRHFGLFASWALSPVPKLYSSFHKFVLFIYFITLQITS